MVKFYKNGFTLIEIILVTVIMAVIAGFAVPNFGSTYRKIRLKKTTEDLAYLMRYAQSRAVVKNREVRLEFDSDFKQYWISQGLPDIELKSASQNFDRFRGRMGKSFDIPEKVDVQAELSFVHFYPNGEIEKNHITVCSGDRCYTISTKEQRGVVRIFDTRLK